MKKIHNIKMMDCEEIQKAVVKAEGWAEDTPVYFTDFDENKLVDGERYIYKSVSTSYDDYPYGQGRLKHCKVVAYTTPILDEYGEIEEYKTLGWQIEEN